MAYLQTKSTWFKRLSLVAAFAFAVTVARQGISVKSAIYLLDLLVVVIGLSIWGWVRSSDERALEAKGKQISILKSLCDSPWLSEEHVGLVKDRLKEETQQTMDIVMGWRKRPNWYGSCAGFGFVVVVLLVPGMMQTLMQLTEVGERTPGLGPQQALYGLYFGLVALGAIVWVFRQLMYRPVRDKVAGKVLSILRAHNGEFEPATYVGRSLVSYFKYWPSGVAESKQSQDERS